MDKKLQCDKEVIKSLFSLLPLYLYIYTRRPSLLSHTGAVAQWRAMVAVAAMAPLTLIPYGCSGAMQGNGCSGCHGAPHSYTDGEQNRSLLHTTCAYGKQSKDLFYTCGKPRFFCKIFDLGPHKPCKSNMVTGPALPQTSPGAA